MTDATASRSARKTTKHSKVRTGCRTCKKRHLKCDETMPFCSRCAKGGFTCDGSASVSAKIDDYKPKRLAAKPALHLAVYSTPSTLLFTNQQEHYCFRVFCDKTALRLSGCFHPGLWHRLVLQVCESDPAIRHAVVAIGALDFTAELYNMSRASSKTVINSLEEIQKHHHFALQQFGTALQKMRNSLSGKTVDMKRALLGCIVVTCFETFHGNHQSAIAQMQSGLALLDEWQMQAAQNVDNPSTRSSPSLLTFDDEVYQALGRLDIQMMSFVDSRSKEFHDRLRHYGSAYTRSMPAQFADLEEARKYLELIMRRVMHFRSSISTSTDYNGCLRVAVGTVNTRDGALSDQMMYKEELMRWHAAFKPLWQPGFPEGKSQSRVAIALKIHYLISVFVINVIPLDPLEVQAFAAKSTSICKKIVSLSHTFIKSSDPDRTDVNFSFDLQIVVPLYITAMRCRHFRTRRQAIALLLLSQRREGLWSGPLSATALRWVVDIEEEEGHVGDYVPPGTGIVDLMYDFNSKTGIIEIKCLQQKKGVVEVIRRNIKIPWKQEINTGI